MTTVTESACSDIAGDIHSPARRASISLWWIGQAGFVARFGQSMVVIDPYLSDALAKKYAGKEFDHVRMMRAPVTPAALAETDWVACTHGHTDHMDAETLTAVAEVSPRTRFLVPAAELQKAAMSGAPGSRTTGIDAGDSLELSRGLKVTALASAHEELRTDEAGRNFYLGYVFEFSGLRVYHSGDCVPYPGLSTTLRALSVDLALLPVNGRDAYRRERGVPGNFEIEEAIGLCEKAGIARMIGHHFGMFAFNTLDTADARRRIRARGSLVDVRLADIGIRYDLAANV